MYWTFLAGWLDRWSRPKHKVHRHRSNGWKAAKSNTNNAYAKCNDVSNSISNLPGDVGALTARGAGDTLGKVELS